MSKRRIIFDIANFSGVSTMTGIPRYIVEILSRLVRRDDLDITTICSLPEEDHAYRNFKKYFPHEIRFQSQNAEHYTPPTDRCFSEKSRLKRLEEKLQSLFPDNPFVSAVARWARYVKWTVAKPPFLSERPRSPFFERLVRESDLYFSPFHPLIPELDVKPGIRTILVVHDMVPVVLADLYQGHGFFQKEPWKTVTRTTSILTVSESTRRDLLAHCPDILPDQVTTVLLGADDRFAPCANQAQLRSNLGKYDIEPDLPYILSVATLEIRKNFDHIMRSFARFIAQYGNDFPDLRLVLTGVRGWQDRRFYKAYGGLSKAVKDRVVFTGYVDDDDLPSLYAGATCFCYMSIYEGFGLPPLEAMKSGTPVIVSNNSSLPEVVGNAGILLDATDEMGLVDAFEKILSNEELRQDLIRRGLERSEQFSWERCANRIIETINESVPIGQTIRRQAFGN